MTNRQALGLRAGEWVRRKDRADDDTFYAVERVERIRGRYVDVAVHAGGRVFMAWEIERCDPLQGGPTKQ